MYVLLKSQSIFFAGKDDKTTMKIYLLLLDIQK